MLYHRSRISFHPKRINLYWKIYIHLPFTLSKITFNQPRSGGEENQWCAKIDGRGVQRIHGKEARGGEEEEEEANGKRSEKGERRRRKGWPAVARRSVEVAGAERGEFQRRDVSTEFQSKKDTRFRRRGTRLPCGEIARDTSAERECVSAPFWCYPPSCSFSLRPSSSFFLFSLSKSIFVIAREVNRSWSIVVISREGGE